MFRNLKGLRKIFKLNQAQLAEAANIHPQTLSKFERGIIVPKRNTIEDLARAFGMTTEDFLNHLDPTCLPTVIPEGTDPPPKGLREIRERARMTQATLARALNMNAVTISNIENGKHYPNPSTAQRLADFFEIPLEEFYRLLTGDGSPFVNCGDCVYWNEIENTRDGECLRSHPTEVLDKVTRRAVWPVTDKDRKCGKGKCK